MDLGRLEYETRVNRVIDHLRAGEAALAAQIVCGYRFNGGRTIQRSCQPGVVSSFALEMPS